MVMTGGKDIQNHQQPKATSMVFTALEWELKIVATLLTKLCTFQDLKEEMAPGHKPRTNKAECSQRKCLCIIGTVFSL